MCTDNVGDPLGIDPAGGAVFKNVPEGAMINEAVETGIFKNMYGSEKAGMDVLGAGPGAQITSGGKTAPGQLDPNDPGDRSIGRTIGTIAAIYAGGSAIGASGGGASGANSASLIESGTVGAEGAAMESAALGAGGTAAGATAGTTAGSSTATPSGAGAATGTGAASGTSILQTAKTVATVLAPVMSIVQSVANTNAIKALEQPKAPPPITLPTSGNENTIKAQQGSIQQQLARRGRASTILTAPAGERLGS